MPSKYYNPRLARSAGKAQASQYVSVSGVIDQAFEPLHEDIRIQQERLYKQNQEKEKQRQEIEKDLSLDMKFAQELKGVIPQGQAGLYQTAMTEQFAEYAKAYREAAGDPIEQQKLKSNFEARLTSHSKPHEIRRARLSGLAERLDKFSISSATSAQDLATYQRIKNFENLPAERVTFHPETGRPVEIIFGEDGKPTGEFFDPIEGFETMNIIDKSGDGVFNDIINTRFPKLLKNAKTSNLTPQASMYQVDAALEGVNDQTALHIGIEHLKIGGANGEFSEYLNAVFNDKDETAIYYDMPNDYDLEEIDEFLNMSEEQKAKIPGITKITGKHGGVEMVKDRLRYIWAQTAADQEADDLEDENNILNNTNPNKASSQEYTEEERIDSLNSMLYTPKFQEADQGGQDSNWEYILDNRDSAEYKSWENNTMKLLQKEGIPVKKGKSEGNNVLYIDVGTKSSSKWQELTPGPDNAETLVGLFPDKTFNTDVDNGSKLLDKPN